MVATLKEKITKKKRYTIYSYSSSRLLIPRGSIVLALWIRWASRALLKDITPIFKFFNRNQKHMIVGMTTG